MGTHHEDTPDRHAAGVGGSAPAAPREGKATRARDALAAERRRMPWLAVEKGYEFEGPHGKRACSACSKDAVS